jgi:hypothetical protein
METAMRRAVLNRPELMRRTGGFERTVEKAVRLRQPMRYRQERMSVISNPCNRRIFVSVPLAPQRADAERTSAIPLSLFVSKPRRLSLSLRRVKAAASPEKPRCRA